ncbi:hypothetical protein [Thermococcus sp.]
MIAMDVSKAEYVLTMAELLQSGAFIDSVEEEVSEVLKKFGNGEISLDEAYSRLQKYFQKGHRRPKPPGEFKYRSEDEVRVAVNTILSSMKNQHGDSNE